MIYPIENFNEEERRRLEPHFTNLDRPVFALVNLPETVKGALFARYSRYSGTLRRLFLDEFAEGLPEIAGSFEGREGSRAAELYERVFLEYGDDSVAQLGGAHVACEWTSNLLTKLIQRPRLASYLEQSTRYIAYDKSMPGGGYRYFRDERLGHDYERAMDRLFEIYSASIDPVRGWVERSYPPPSDNGDGAAHRRAVTAKTLDLLRGLLPAATLSHQGIYASGQSYESLIMRLLASELPEARAYGKMIFTEVSAVMPSFVARINRPERGGQWIDQLRERAHRARSATERLGLDQQAQPAGPSVRLLTVDGDERRLLAALLAEHSTLSEEEVAGGLAQLDDDGCARAIAELVGPRDNRRHRPGRGFEALRYRFEIVSDYGAFRDLQRHRLLTVQWQGLTPDLGAEVPEEVSLAGVGDEYAEALEVSASAYHALKERGFEYEAPYSVCLAYRLRYVLDMNAREAIHLIELRSGAQGHPSYRAVAQEMYRQIAEVHPAVAAAMEHVDLSSEPRLERLLSEIRAEGRRRERAPHA